MGGSDGAVPADCCACSPSVPAAARKVTAAERPMKVARQLLLVVMCIYFFRSFGVAKFYQVEPNSIALVVYDAVNHVWDDEDTSVFTSLAVDKIVTIGQLWA